MFPEEGVDPLVTGEDYQVRDRSVSCTRSLSGVCPWIQPLIYVTLQFIDPARQYLILKQQRKLNIFDFSFTKTVC